MNILTKKKLVHYLWVRCRVSEWPADPFNYFVIHIFFYFTQNFEDAKNLLKKQMFDDVDDEDGDTINWDGSSVASSGRVGSYLTGIKKFLILKNKFMK